MSLEQAIKENTEVLRELVRTLQNSVLRPSQESAPSKKPASTPSANAPEKVATPEVAVESPSKKELTYADIQKPFLKLVAKDRAAAVDLLGAMGVKTLKEFEGKSHAQYVEVLAAIEEKLNG